MDNIMNGEKQECTTSSWQKIVSYEMSPMTFLMCICRPLLREKLPNFLLRQERNILMLTRNKLRKKSRLKSL
ncbi:hypothetical protein MTR67_002278 [Solanum verrucosum]|uniref:Uncharacterized protein n=1 Tax=Solanum verrucosum TaxID=315347 RepID=A0AAF0PPM7_SOLVR|nr:hypothetical protein MTR67_002278 [Solanum verrucosum]